MPGNQLFAPALKGVIDFGFARLARKRARFFAHSRGQTKNRSEAELDEAEIDKSMLLMPDNHKYLCQIKIQKIFTKQCINRYGCPFLLQSISESDIKDGISKEIDLTKEKGNVVVDFRND
jgi:hypothetical protein